MGFFSFFSSKKTTSNRRHTDNELGQEYYLDRDFFISLADNSSSMMLYFLKKEGWIGANETFFRKMDYENIEEFKNQNDSVRDIFLTESEEIFTESDQSWLDYIKKHHSKGYRVIISKPRNRTMTIDAKCHTFAKNKNFYVLELDDVTNLVNAKSQTQEIEKLKTKFLANIGHEFRTPMHGILGFVELLEQTNLDKIQHEYLKMINNSSRNLITNIETLLDLSQLQGGRLEVDSYALNILPEMEALAYHFYVIGTDKGIKVLTFIDPKIPQEVMSDNKKITQIMFSLMQNAIKLTPRGGKVILEVKLLKRQQNGNCSIGFGVRDNGKGISSEQIAKINEPFTSGSQADERLGVGLALSNGLVNLLGSKLKIQSKEDEGSYVNFVLDFKASKGQNFKMIPKKKVKILLLNQKRVDEANFLTIYLRSFAVDVIKSNQLDKDVYNGIDALYIVANQADSSWMLELGTYSKKTPVILLLEQDEKLLTKLTHIVDKVVREPLLPSSIAKHLYSSKELAVEKTKKATLDINTETHALIVEDNLINQRLIQILLQGYDISTTTASNGVEAVRASEQKKFDIIFMDIDMPEKDGIEVTREIKNSMNINKLTPIVALTSMAMEGDREMLMENGLDNYLSKPLNKNQLESILNKYLKVVV